jgi:beta-glucosidase
LPQKSGQKIALLVLWQMIKQVPRKLEIAADDEYSNFSSRRMQKYINNQISYAKGADVAVGRTQFVGNQN